MPIDTSKGPGGVDASYGRRTTVNSFDRTKTYDQGLFVNSDGQIVTPSGDVVVGGGVVPGMVNWKYSNTSQIRAAMLGAAASDLRSRWILGSDSLFAGTASTNNGLVNARSKSWPRQFAALLKANGYQAYENWACGNGSNGGSLASYLGYDPRMAFGSQATLNTTWWGFAGPSWNLAADAVNAWVDYTPLEPFDTLDIGYAVASGTGVFRLLDQASAQAGANINTVSGTNGFAESTITFPAGSTKARAIYVSTNFCLIGGMGSRNASANGIELVNASISGIETNFFNANGGNDWAAHRAALPVMLGAATAGRNVYIMGGGYNDIYIGGQTISTVQSRMRSRINYLRSLVNAPDIVVVGYPNLALTLRDEAAQAALNEALRSVAVDEFDLPFVDLRLAGQTNAIMQAQGQASADGLHLRAAGYGITAEVMFRGCTYAARLTS